LPALIAGIGIVFRAEEFEVRSRRAKVVGDLLAQIGGVVRPVGGSLNQGLVMAFL